MKNENPYSPPFIFQAPISVASARQSAESFLAALDPGANRFTFQSFTDSREKGEAHKARRESDPLARVLHGSLDEHWNKLVELSAAGAGIFVTVNETDFRGRAADHITRVRTYVGDLDGAPIQNLLRLEFRPHFVTQTSIGRYHAYWLVDGAALDKFRSTQKRIARLMEGDLNVCDLPRVMRLPGFPHQKDPTKPFLVEVARLEPELPYRDADFQAALARAEKDQPKLTEPNTASQHAAPTQANGIENTPGRKPDYLIQPPGRQRLTDRAMASLGPPNPDMKQGFPDGFRTHELARRAGWCLGKNGGDMTEDEAVAACLDWNQNNTPPLPEEKVRVTVASIAKTEARQRQTLTERRIAPPTLTPSEWPEPHPLPEALLPVDPFNFELMPSQLRPWVQDVSDRMQCPPDFVAVSVMAGIGSVIGRKVALRPQTKNDWEVVPNQWALLIGRPGILKSPAMEEALRPLKKLAVTAEDIFGQAQDQHEIRAKVSKLQADENTRRAAKLLKGNPTADVSSLLSANDNSEEPTLRRYIANDTNVASLGVLLQQNPNGLLVFRDELVSLLDNLDQEENVTERGFYLTAWSGDSSYTFDRIGRGLHLSIPGICLSLLGSSQPGRVSQYLFRAIRGGRGDDGLIQRFGLLVWPNVSSEWKNVDRLPDAAARTTAFEVFKRLDEFDWHAIGAVRDRDPTGDETGLPYLRFDTNAQDRFIEWRTKLEKCVRGGDSIHPALESHLAKYRKLVPALALACHLVDDPGSSLVSAASLERALAWAKYLETHARRAYGSVTAASAATAEAIVAKIRSGDLKPEFRSHEVWRPGWSKLSDRDAVKAALELLVDYDWLAVRKVETAGRPGFIYAANPRIVKS